MEEITSLFDAITTEEDQSERLILINELRAQVDDLIGDNIRQKEDLIEMEQEKNKWMDKSYDLFHQLGDQNQHLQGHTEQPKTQFELTPDTVGSLFN